VYSSLVVSSYSESDNIDINASKSFFIPALRIYLVFTISPWWMKNNIAEHLNFYSPRCMHRYLMTRLSLQVIYLWCHVSSTAPPFTLWWSNLEILFGPLHRRSPFIGELRCQAIQMEQGPYIAERTQNAVYIMRCLSGVWGRTINLYRMDSLYCMGFYTCPCVCRGNIACSAKV
jgi:hypothetical protein